MSCHEFNLDLSCRLPHPCTQVEKKLNEYTTIPLYTFRNGLSEACRRMMSNAENLRAQNGRYWLSFVSFLSEVYKQLRFQRDPILAIGRVLFDALFCLAQPPCSNNIEEVFHGIESSDKSGICKIRGVNICKNISKYIIIF